MDTKGLRALLEMLAGISVLPLVLLLRKAGKLILTLVSRLWKLAMVSFTEAVGIKRF
jgi:hypothetical protein